MLCMACGSRDAETDGLMCGACRAAVDGGLGGADAGAEVFNCVPDGSPAEPVGGRDDDGGDDDDGGHLPPFEESPDDGSFPGA